MTDLDRDNPAWRFALDLYGRQGVPPELVRLQDEAGADVSLLLVCLWLGAERGIALTAADLAEAEAVAGPWRGMVVRRLRSARRDLKAAPEMELPAVALFRKSLQAIEIESERIEIALLHAWSERALAGRAREPDAALRNLALVAGRPLGETDGLRHLRAALGEGA